MPTTPTTAQPMPPPQIDGDKQSREAKKKNYTLVTVRSKLKKLKNLVRCSKIMHNISCNYR